MRRLVLCFLLCLMPLRLWAGAWMPVTPTGSHPQPATLSTALAQPTPTSTATATATTTTETGHDCHEAMAPALHHGQAQPSPGDGAALSAGGHDCHDGTCQLCGVCHQTASLTAWTLVAPDVQAYPLPVGAALAHVARTSPPLTKPPIS